MNAGRCRATDERLPNAHLPALRRSAPQDRLGGIAFCLGLRVRKHLLSDEDRLGLRRDELQCAARPGIHQSHT